jgi:hypothetical protein
MHRKNLAVALVAIIISVTLALCVFWQYNIYQTETNQLRNQNTELQTQLQTQNNTLQTQLKELYLQNREQQDRLSDFTGQLALQRSLRIELTNASCSRGWAPLGGLTVIHSASVTILNNDVVPLFGLTATFSFIDRDSGAMIGQAGVSSVGRINVGESKVVLGGPLTALNINMGDGLDADSVCRITVSKGGIILGALTTELS